MTAEIPGSGFVWLPLDSATRPAEPPKVPAVPMAEPHVLRNEFFEKSISTSRQVESASSKAMAAARTVSATNWHFGSRASGRSLAEKRTPVNRKATTARCGCWNL